MNQTSGLARNHPPPVAAVDYHRHHHHDDHHHHISSSSRNRPTTTDYDIACYDRTKNKNSNDVHVENSPSTNASMSINTPCRDRITSQRRNSISSSNNNSQRGMVGYCDTNIINNSIDNGTCMSNVSSLPGQDGGQGRWERKRLLQKSLMKRRCNDDDDSHHRRRHHHRNGDDDTTERDIYYDDLDSHVMDRDNNNDCSDSSLSLSSISKINLQAPSMSTPPPALSRTTLDQSIKPYQEQEQQQRLQRSTTRSQYRNQRRRSGSLTKNSLRRVYNHQHDDDGSGRINIPDQSDLTPVDADKVINSPAGKVSSSCHKPGGDGGTIRNDPRRHVNNDDDDIDDGGGYSIVITDTHSAPHERTQLSPSGSWRGGRTRYQRRSSISRHSQDRGNNNVVVGQDGEEETSTRSSKTVPALPSSTMMTTVASNPGAGQHSERSLSFRPSRYYGRRGGNSPGVSPIHQRNSLRQLGITVDDGTTAATTPSRSVSLPLHDSPTANKGSVVVSPMSVGTNHTGLYIRRRGSMTGSNRDMSPQKNRIHSPRRRSLDFSSPQKNRTSSPRRRIIVQQNRSSSLLHKTCNNSSSSHLTAETTPLDLSDSSIQCFGDGQNDTHQHPSVLKKTRTGSTAVSHHRGVARHHHLKKRPTVRGGVHFGTVHIYEFKVRIGDNPACSSGCPVMLERFHDAQHSFSVDAYERLLCLNNIDRSLEAVSAATTADSYADDVGLPKQQRLRQERQKRQLQYCPPERVGGDVKDRDVNKCPILSTRERSIRLLQAGYSLDEMAKATLAVQQIRAQRQATAERHGWGRLNTFVKTIASHLVFGNKLNNQQ